MSSVCLNKQTNITTAKDIKLGNGRPSLDYFPGTEASLSGGGSLGSESEGGIPGSSESHVTQRKRNTLSGGAACKLRLQGAAWAQFLCAVRRLLLPVLG